MKDFPRSKLRLVPAFLFLLACQDDPEDAAPDTGSSTPVDAVRSGDAAQPEAGGGSGLDAGGSSGLDASGSTARDASVGTFDAARDTGPSGSQSDSAAIDAGRSDAAATSCATMEEQRFSFFMTSFRALQRESGSQDGFGGNLGGITGADAICQRIAEHSSACQKSKSWRAFLSTTKEHAIDRIGKGPWHDRLGRLVANNLQDLAQERPRGAHMQILNDLPNEDGVPNRNPDGTGNVDNHQTITGSGVDGKLYTQGMGSQFGGTACGPQNEAWTPEKATCWDWTSSKPEGCPRVGHSWPRQGSGLHWISVWNEGGCAPGAVLADIGGPDGTRRIGSGGGYGGFYCFAITSQ